jgi:NDP-sugar pyrophosphorylase family protein
VKAVILAGGKGTRLQPYTVVLPKPLMPIADVPILDVVIRQLKAHGFRDITISVGYLAELIMAYCRDGERYQLQLCYSTEEEPLGTAGPLAEIQHLDDTFLVMNGDILTTLNYSDLIAYHKKHKATATIATHRRKVVIDFGVMEIDRHSNELREYREKPTLEYSVSMGIYVFEPEVLRYITKGQKLDFPELAQKLVASREKVLCYFSDEYWLDIGRPDDYRKAVEEFDSLKDRLLKT